MGLFDSVKKAFSKPYKTIGVRSASAARLLAAKGYDAYSVCGGMAAWCQAGEPVR